MTCIGLLSDTHGDVEAAQEALRLLEQGRAEQIIHCGDVGLSVLKMLPAGRTHVVAGNTDELETASRVAACAGLVWHGRFGRLRIGETRIAFLHGDDRRAMRDAIHGGEFDLVFCGHTHSAEDVVVGGVRVINPGAVVRSSSPSVAIVEIPDTSNERDHEEEFAEKQGAGVWQSADRADVRFLFLREHALSPEQLSHQRELITRHLVPTALLQLGILNRN